VTKSLELMAPRIRRGRIIRGHTSRAVYSFLKTQYSLTVNKVRGLGNVASYALFSILCLALNRKAAENTGRHDNAASPTYFNTSYRTRQHAVAGNQKMKK
jgi:hypothetical protein